MGHREGDCEVDGDEDIDDKVNKVGAPDGVELVGLGDVGVVGDSEGKELEGAEETGEDVTGDLLDGKLLGLNEVGRLVGDKDWKKKLEWPWGAKNSATAKDWGIE